MDTGAAEIYDPDSSTFFTVYDCLPPKDKRQMVAKAVSRMSQEQLKKYGVKT